MKLKFLSNFVMVLMFLASGLAIAFHPTKRIADGVNQVELESMIPTSFEDWKISPNHSMYIINPLTKERLEKIYSQTLSRIYINQKGDTVMLSIAYGGDQSDDKALHYPEVCYPAQGFQVVSNSSHLISTEYGQIKTKRLITRMGNRIEPLTYWSTVGNKVVYAGLETKLEQLHYGFSGQIPDGLLFRVSSITADVDAAYMTQDSFVKSLIKSIPKSSRLRLAGINPIGIGE